MITLDQLEKIVSSLKARGLDRLVLVERLENSDLQVTYKLLELSLNQYDTDFVIAEKKSDPFVFSNISSLISHYKLQKVG